MKQTIKSIYAEYGIKYENGKIYSEYLNMWINPLLIDGNSKIGKGCYHFSTLPTMNIYHVIINGMPYDVKGTCVCSCEGCYATKGNYRFNSVIVSLAIKTILIRNDLDFVKRAILAQIKAEKIKLCRIHASGDFDSVEYAMMWKEIVTECADVAFWTYTKVKEFESLFDGIDNANIVKSVIKGYGFNFGKCEYIMKLYQILTDMGKSVYICRCGIDKNQHCTNCHSCSKYEYVLFIEHSTDYKAENDSNFNALKTIIENQKTA